MSDITPEQIAIRCARTLERVHNSMTPEFIEAIGDIPFDVVWRLREAIRELNAKTGALSNE